MTEQYEIERKKKTSVLTYFLSFTNFKGIQGFYTKFQVIFMVQGAKINSRLFKGFKEPWEHRLMPFHAVNLVLTS